MNCGSGERHLKKQRIIKSIGMVGLVLIMSSLVACGAKPADQNEQQQESRAEAKRQSSVAQAAAVQAEVEEYQELLQKAQVYTQNKQYNESNAVLDSLSVPKLNTTAFANVKATASHIREQNVDGFVTQAKAQAAAQKRVKPKQVVKKLSTAQKDAFTEWATAQAKTNGMAVAKRYFDSAENKKGDWYANTVNGRIQVKNNNLPGKAKFPLHAMFGLVFYYAKDGTTGYDSKTDSYTMANDYRNTRQRKKVYKYMLADDGKVYVWSNKAGGYAVDGFAELNKKGHVAGNIPAGTWVVAKNPATQAEYQKVLGMK